jgi:hypothetical protein
MKIKDVIIEGLFDKVQADFKKGQQLVRNPLGNSFANVRANFNKGRELVRNPLGLKGSSTPDSSTGPKASNWQKKDSLKKAVNGDALQTFDRQTLQQVYSDVQSKKIKADQNTVQVLKSAYSNQELSDEQRQQLAQLLNQY